MIHKSRHQNHGSGLQHLLCYCSEPATAYSGILRMQVLNSYTFFIMAQPDASMGNFYWHIFRKTQFDGSCPFCRQLPYKKDVGVKRYFDPYDTRISMPSFSVLLRRISGTRLRTHRLSRFCGYCRTFHLYAP